MNYDHKKIEKKWQKKWAEDKLYASKESEGKKKSYVLDMFPYPSGEGLHVGHPKGYIATDIYARRKRMEGHSVLHPMGWDAFGLPAENFAIKNKIHPRIAVEKNIKRFKEQLENIGFDYDWDREINTTDPNYFKWTQWIFLQLFKKGLAYQSNQPINWCPSCMTGLANEDLDDGHCERCGSVVEKRRLPQWVLKITDYADRLLANLDTLEGWPEHIKESQRNWIGRSEGAEIDFPIALNKKYKFVILHGYTGTPEADFIPWLKKELEKQGHQVVTPMLPHHVEEGVPEKEDIQAAMEAAEYDSDTIIVGHSLGAVVTLKILEKINISVAGAILVGGFIDPKFKDHTRPFENTFTWHFDGKKIKQNSDFIKILQDKNDDAVSRPQAERLSALLNVPIQECIAEESHFCGTEEPEVLAAVLPSIRIFTTRPDTLFGATYMVLAPEHPLVQTLKNSIENWDEALQYSKASQNKTEIERTAEGKEKTGVELKGVRAVNPANKEEIPVFIADYVLADYGTGAIMAVPAHDERDFEFAKKFNLPIQRVINGGDISTLAYGGQGTLVNSNELNGLSSQEAKIKITEKFGRKKVTYKLRDWVFSRQRYWGEPIPIIHCEKCGATPVPEKDLPVMLPEVKNYEPSGTGESPLATITQWVNTTCPKCGGPGKRETNTMPQWAGSSWYWLRYMDPHNDAALVAPEKEKYWAPVDMYVGGAEHATRHLIYARFWHTFLHDIGVVSTLEPFSELHSVGLIIAEDGRKMSKRFGNVINPDDIVDTYGADSLRVYEMFMGPFENAIAWNTQGLIGARRFIERVWRLQEKAEYKGSTFMEVEVLLQQTIKKVGEDIEAFKFNTAVSQLMIFLNAAEKNGVGEQQWKIFLQLLAPFAPHVVEELWHMAGESDSIHRTVWPQFDELKILSDRANITVQINGKVREIIEMPRTASNEEVETAGRKAIAKKIGGKTVKKVIVVPGRLVNFVLDEV